MVRCWPYLSHAYTTHSTAINNITTPTALRHDNPSELVITTSFVWWQDNLGKPVQKCRTNLAFTAASDDGLVEIPTGTVRPVTPHNHQNANTPKFFLQAGCLSCHSANSVKALKAGVTFIEIARSLSTHFLCSQAFFCTSSFSFNFTALLCQCLVSIYIAHRR